MKALFAFAVLLMLAVLGLALVGQHRRGAPPSVNPYERVLPLPPPGLEAAAPGPCLPAGEFQMAGNDNARSLVDLNWAPFRRPETGWQIYAPHVAREINTACGPGASGFARALSQWQRRHGLAADGRMTPETFERMRQVWHSRRPLRGQLDPANCPAAPPPSALATARSDEAYGGKTAQLRPPVLNALRRMREAARREVPGLANDPNALDIISAWRDPAADTARCLLNGDCDNVRRSSCSAHLTGLAVDLYVGEAPGYSAASTEAINRLHQSRTPAYRWMVANAARFGFVNYVFEPWHWEWGGDQYAPRETATQSTGAPSPGFAGNSGAR